MDYSLIGVPFKYPTVTQDAASVVKRWIYISMSG